MHAVDDEAHMIWGCPALIDQRVQHSELFVDSTITSVSDFLQQDAGQLAPFLRVCHDQCRAGGVRFQPGLSGP